MDFHIHIAWHTILWTLGILAAVGFGMYVGLWIALRGFEEGMRNWFGW